MSDFDEYERPILDEFQRRDVRAECGVGDNVLLRVSLADRRDAAIESLIAKCILARNKSRLILTESGGRAVYP
jgi:hypothetical protein